MRITIFIFFLLGCQPRLAVSDTSRKVLPGSYFTYHSALGAGRGIHFRVTIPPSLAPTFFVDSFYVRGKPQAFELIRTAKEVYVEANLYAATPQSAYGGKEAAMDAATTLLRDSIIDGRRFYPSWMIGRGRAGKERIDIISYHEIIGEKKY